MNHKEPSSIVFRVMILGDSSVGKTSLMSKYMSGIFYPDQLATIGIDYQNKKIVKSNFNIKLQIWDTAGDERYSTLTNVSLKDADAIVIAYDISNIKSFESIQNKWLGVSQTRGKKDVITALVGTKNDLSHKRQIKQEEGAQLALYHQMMFFETSAKDDVNIERLFEQLTDAYIERGIYSHKGNGYPIKEITLEREMDPQSCSCSLSKLWCS